MTLRIKNWDHYQSYKDRKPPWIRLHRSLIDNPDFQKMSADSRALLPMLWLLACEDKDPVSGLVRMSHEDIAWRLRIDIGIIKKSIEEVQAAGFIECIESVTDPLQDSISTVTPETETETEERQSRGRAKRISDEWLPSPDNILFAINEGFQENQVGRIADKFKDYWTAASGRNAAKKDWDATWRNWVRREAERVSVKKPERMGTMEAARSILAEMRL